MRQIFGFFVACAVVAALPTAVLAASIAPDRSTYVVGDDIRITSDTPTAEDFPRPWVGFYPKGKDARITYQYAKKGRGVLTFRAPDHPGEYEFRLTINEKQVLSRVTIRTIVPPASGAIGIPKRSFTIGERIELRMNLPAGRRLPRPWVGLFNKGQRIDSGSVVNDSRRTYLYVTKDKPLVFTAPEVPGVYEFRLYDRDGEPYKLDSAAFEVKAPPVRGAMKLSKRLFTVGEPITMDIDLPEGRFYGRSWVGLYTANTEAPGGAMQIGARSTYLYVPKEKKLTFTAPNSPGRYVFRLFDRDDRKFLLDTISFEVEVPPLPGAMKLAKRLFTVGEPITMDIDLPAGRFYGRSWVGLYTANTEVPGGAMQLGARSTYLYVPKEKKLTFTAPNSPGRYVFRLFDRDDSKYLLDTISFEVEVPPLPGAMKLSKQLFTVGEPITMDIDLPTGRFYGRSWVGLYSANTKAPGGAMQLGTRLTYLYVPKEKKLTFTTPVWAGQYVFRLFDRDDSKFLLDTISFEVEVPPIPGALSVAPGSVRVGGAVSVTVSVPAGRTYPRLWVGLYGAGHKVSGGASKSEHRPSWLWAKSGQKLKFTAPTNAGRYEFRLFDREGGRFILDVATLIVTDPKNPSRPGAVDRETPLPKGMPGDSPGPGDPLKDGSETAKDDPAKDAPTLRFVHSEGGAWSAVAGALPYGREISAEATFKDPPNEESLEADLNVPGGGTRTVTLRRTDNPSVFRSGPFILSVPKEGSRL